MSIVSLIKNHRRSAIWHHMAKIICIVPLKLSPNQREIILQAFFFNGFWNVVLAYESVKGIEYETIKPYGNQYKIITITNPSDSSLIFPDKLNNLEGFEYQVVSVNNVSSSYISSFMIHFLHAIKNQQNSTFKLLILKDTVMMDYWRRRKMHLLISVSTVIDSPEPTLMTYEEKSYCALVPIPQKASFILLFITKPFDRFTWMLIALSVVCSVAVWRIFRGRGAVDSHWKVAAVMFMIFIGQGLEFSRRNRTVLLILVHLISISMFILSNAYESFITSFMIDPGKKYLKSVNDLWESHFEIIADEAVQYNFRNYAQYSSRITSSNLPTELNYETNSIQQRYALVRLCYVAEQILNAPFDNKRFWSDYYYILPERIPSQFIKLEASFLNPFIERFQYYMDLSFEAGLPKMWKAFEPQVISKPKESADYLELKDLGPIFLILFIGCALSIFMLVIEISYHDIFRNLDWTRPCRWIKNWLSHACCRKNKNVQKPKVRRIVVKPRRNEVKM